MSKKSKFPKDWREGRRIRAWELHEQGWKQKDIAAALGVSEGAVSQWFKKAKTMGVEALQHLHCLTRIFPHRSATPFLSCSSLTVQHGLKRVRGLWPHRTQVVQ